MLSHPPITQLDFFLGGRDLEMATIRELLEQEAPGQLFDRGLHWGAQSSAYREEIERSLAAGRTPVLVELIEDLQLAPERYIEIDHHGRRAGERAPTSLHQVFELLGLPPERWTRWFDLVAANDRGYLPAMLELGAGREEMIEIRAADRRAQGIGEAEEIEAERAVRQREPLAGGQVTLIRLGHQRTAAAVDRLQPELGGPGAEQVLVLSPGEVNFFGSGDLVVGLERAFPGGWYGGSLPKRGFWGKERVAPEAVVSWLEKRLAVTLTA